MAKVKGKQEAKEHEPGSDPKVLYKNYLQACDAIGIQHFPPLKHILTNEENPNIGTQIVVVGEGNSVLGPGGCRALVNAMIGKPNATTTTIAPFTATKEIRIIRCNLQDGGAAAIAKLLFATAGRKCINTAGDGATLPPEWKLDYLELMDNDISRDGAMVLGRSLSVGVSQPTFVLIYCSSTCDYCFVFIITM